MKIVLMGLLIIACSLLSSCQQNGTSKQTPSGKEELEPAQTSLKQEPVNGEIPEPSSQTDMADEESFQKAFVEDDGNIIIAASRYNDHKFFGYSNPDTTSEKLLCFSIFTSDVKNNPHHCKFGAYYESSNMADSISLKYRKTTGDFVEAVITSSNDTTTVYFQKKWITVEK